LTYLRSWAALPAAQLRMIIALAIAVALANICQPYPEIAPLQHLPTALLILFAPWLLRRWPLSDGSVGCILAFFLLHTLAGRYTYSNVPYDAWVRTLLSVSIDRTFGLVRNDFDRLVHLSFGLFAIKPFAEAAGRHGGMGRKAAIFSAFLFVGAVSAIYEAFEWLLTIVLAPGTADDYNGQQGDMWDSQKDMTIAMMGGLITSLWMLLRNDRRVRS
jgi:putative membrane protein